MSDPWEPPLPQRDAPTSASPLYERLAALSIPRCLGFATRARPRGVSPQARVLSSATEREGSGCLPAGREFSTWEAEVAEFLEVKSAALHELVPEDASPERVAGGFAFTEGPVWRGDQLVF